MLSSCSAPRAVLPRSQFAGSSIRQCAVNRRQKSCQARRSVAPAADAAIQFIRGVDEPCVPDVQLTRAKDGSSGTATFIFKEPSVFEASEDLGEITGLYMLDAEGELNSIDVQAKFVNGKPDRIEARFLMKSSIEWDRFMRFMDRYAEDKGLGFNKAK